MLLRRSLAHCGLEFPVETSVSQHVPWREVPSFRLIESQLTRVREMVCRALSGSSSAGELKPLLDYLSAQSGKMVRSGLVLLAGQCFGPSSDKHIRVAAAVEMIHHATLLHDDVIDEGQMRRGAATVNRMWGNESAVLLGDFVLSQVFRLVADFDSAVAKVLGDTAARVCQGELRQVMQRQNWQLTESEYLSIITEKSAAFFSGVCRLGAMLSDAAEPQVEAMARYGLHAGIAFQITDDLLDVAGDENCMGKTGRSDLRRNKLTLPVIHLLDTIAPVERDKVLAILDSPVESAGVLEEMLARWGSLEYARDCALDHVRRAETALEGLSNGEAKDAMVETVRFMAHRAA